MPRNGTERVYFFTTPRFVSSVYSDDNDSSQLQCIGPTVSDWRRSGWRTCAARRAVPFAAMCRSLRSRGARHCLAGRSCSQTA